jgi:hypothetical protein
MSKTSSKDEKVKTTLLIGKRLKKLAQMYALQNDMTLQEVVEKALERSIVSGS